MSEGDTTLREEDISSEQSLVGARAEVADVDGDDSTGTESDTDGTDSDSDDTDSDSDGTDA
ncbi:MAG: hypothetical protein ACRDKK_04330 [Gaiellaceae bacterium]|jgi:hypothetical protein